MDTECKPKQLEFQSLGRREVIGRFDGGRITSDGGGLLLREVDRCIGLLDRLADCFADYRNPESIEHSVRELVAQRVYGLALGYEDLNDHDGLRKDSTLALQASLRSRERFWDIRVPKIDSIFDNSLVPRPSWSPGVPPQHRKLVAATHRSPI